MSVDFAPRFFQRTIYPFCLIILAATFLVGCNDEKTRNLIDQRAAAAQKAMGEMANYDSPKRYNPLVITDKVWTGNSALRMHRGMPIPTKFEGDKGITLISAEPMTLSEIAGAISAQTGIPVRQTEVGSTSGGRGAAAAAAAAGGASNAPTMPMAYEGSLSGLMEKVAGNFGVNWRFDGASISISRFETRVFVVEALPGTQTISEGMQDEQGSGGGGGGGGGGSGRGGGGSSQSSIKQNSTFNLDFKFWDELNQILGAMLGGTGTVITSPSVGTVTVTTTPEIMRTIAAYMEKENQRLSRQIAINVEIYSVGLSDGTDFKVAFDTALRRLRNFGVNFSSAAAPSSVSGFSGFTGGGILSTAILNPATVGEVTDVFTALSGIGDTTKVAKFPLVTLNNRPVSRRIGTDVAYVANSTTANTTTGSTSNIGTQVTPATIRQGFSVQLTPRLLDDGRILMQYSLSVVDIRSIASFNSVCGSDESCSGGAGSTTVQLPQTLNRIFVQQSVLKSGSTLLMGGAEEEDLQHNSQGVGSPYNYILGGGTSAGRSHTMLFIAITPQVLNEPHSEND